ncbi:MAG: PIG-L family deacetylase [Burkholderiaceae bacterium]
MSTADACAARANGTLLVVSPHCDDGVLGCGDLIRAHPGARVVTVFAAGPERYGAPSDWDRRAGFGPGEDVMAARRAEDRDALAMLGATPCWLPFRDAQYAPPPRSGLLAHDLAGLIEAADPSWVALPLGLFHSDHALVHAAALQVLREDPARRTRTWLAYADALYRRLPGLVAERLAGLAADGVQTTPWPVSGSPASLAKRRAIACYASQLRALESPGRPGFEDALLPERYWRLAVAANGRAAGGP